MPIKQPSFFAHWTKLEEKFPEWNVQHSGGGIWLLTRVFTNLKGKETFVSLSSQGNVAVFRNPSLPADAAIADAVLSRSEFTELEETLDDSCVFIYDNGRALPVSFSLFDENTVGDIIFAARQF